MKSSRRIIAWGAAALALLLVASIIRNSARTVLGSETLETREFTKSVKVWFAGPPTGQSKEFKLTEAQAEELFALLASARRLPLPTKMVSLGAAEIALVNGTTQTVSLLTIPNKWDALQIQERQYVIQPSGQIARFLSSLRATANQTNP